jgi:hypothetical protein
MIQIIVTLTKIVISVMGSLCHTSQLSTNINHHTLLNLLFDFQILILHHPNLWQK